MSGVQYNGSYGVNLTGTISTNSPPVDDNTSVALSVAHNALCYSAEHQNDRTTNGSTCK